MIPLAVQEWSLRRLDRMALRLRGRPAFPEHLRTGLAGEREALFHLRRLGYTVVARRWTTVRVRGDLDLVAWLGEVLCFIEVKSRTARDGMAAEVAVDRDKRLQLRRLAWTYLKGFDEPRRAAISTRFDIVSVYLLNAGVQCEVLEDAFGWKEQYGSGWRSRAV